MRLIKTIGFILAMGALVGCGGGDDDGGGNTGGGGSGGGGSSGGGGGSGGSSGGGSSSSFTCCINDTYFICPDMAAMNKCSDFINPDPSQCAKQSDPCPGSGSGGSGSGGSGSGGSGSGGSGSGGSGSGGSGGGADVGKTCTGNADCASNLCLFHGDVAYGYCTIECESFSECPSFWDCTNVGNASGTYCVKD
jgi:hypothetical protein